jgi:hypothetical protein
MPKNKNKIGEITFLKSVKSPKNNENKVNNRTGNKE